MKTKYQNMFGRHIKNERISKNGKSMHVFNTLKTQLLSSIIFSLLLASGSANAQVTFAQAPLLTLKTAPGLVMLTMGRDLPLFRAAYNDVNDLDGDGIPDLFFKPSFKYEGYFAYDRCYNYDNTAGNKLFKSDATLGTVVINAADTSKNYYKCPGKWSGNFLNWVSMSRMDVLRKVLYGGKRSTDTTTSSVLERAFVPQDSTMWGKEYSSVANDGYDIRDYTPLALPTGTTRHMFANTTLQYAPTDYSARWTINVNPPVVIVYQNRPGRIWDLVAQEALILGNNPGTNPAASVSEGTIITQYNARVEVCKVLINGKYEDWCTPYVNGGTTTYKPTGLLHKYGESSKTLAFGLISGTYDNNYSGGVLRQNIDDFSQEVTPTTGIYNTAVRGIVAHLNAFRPWGFGGSDWGCGSFTSLPNEGTCMAWGNPLGEMMFEGLKYFSGGTKTSAFSDKLGTGNSPEAAAKLNLKSPAWINPYAANATRKNTAAYPICARPIQMTIGDPRTSFDGDQLPGSAFPIQAGMGTASTNAFASLDVSNQADLIWASEFGAGTNKTFFIGEGPGNADGNPSPKVASSFKNIRGHGPDGTTNQGSFYGASIARYGKYVGITNSAANATSTNPLRVDQISIALDSHVPQIKIPLGNPIGSKTVTIIPLSKSVNLYGISNAKGSFQQTGAITAFFIDQMANTSSDNVSAVNGWRPYYKFRISFSDSDQGNDNESDAKVTYEIKVTNVATGTFTVGMDYFNGTNGIEMHMGYAIGGTTADGVYLDVGGGGGFGVPPVPAVGYFLDTLPGGAPGYAMTTGTGPNYTNIPGRLPRQTLVAQAANGAVPEVKGPRPFTAGTSAVASAGQQIPHDMLWYAAKYGGAVVDISGGFNFKLKPNGDPENYFPANNPSELSAQMGQAFQKAAALSSATSSANAGNGQRVGGGSFLYQASYDTIKWGGDLVAYGIDIDGNVSSAPSWKVSTALPAPAARTIVLGRGASNKVTVTPTSYSTLTAAEQTDFKDESTFKYILGDRTNEQASPGGTLRNRTSAVGDIVNSDPLYINSADFGYTDAAYQTFKVASAPQLVGVGSNDGFFRLVSASNGVEQLAYMPFQLRSQYQKLAAPGYEHQYFVDGPANFGHVLFSGSPSQWTTVIAASLGAGGQSIFALRAPLTGAPTSNDFLWEYGNSADLGNVINKPIIGMLENGTTPVVIVGNGLNSTNGKAALLVINAQTGALVRTCTPSNAANTAGNGLGSISAVSINNNGKISYVYGADYKGNLWRIDPNLSTGCSTNAERIFSAVNSSAQKQPITGELAVIKAPSSKTGYMILFGTGSYITAADAGPSATQVQSLYGLWDDLGTGGITRAMLSQQTILTPPVLSGTRSTSAYDASTNQYWYDRPGFKGWYLDLSCSDSSICQSGERVVSQPTIQKSVAGDRVFFLSLVPSSDACQVGGGGWLTALDPVTGMYVKGFETMDPNSTYIAGVTPRGLYLATRTATANNPTTNILFVSVTISGGVLPNPRGTVSSGGTQIGTDGSGTGSIGLGTSPPNILGSSGNFGTRRQVWRQIQ